MTPRLAVPEDAPEIARIYGDAIMKTAASFWTEPRPVSEIEQQMREGGDRYPWVVAGDPGSLLGVAWSKRWNPRQGYDITAEVSVYIDEPARGKGVARSLYTDLIARLREIGFHNVIGGIALPNEASVRLHEGLGFKRVALFEQVGVKWDRVMDVGYWQLILREFGSN